MSLGEAVIAGQLRGTAAPPTFFRMSSGPGWALVGDAGHHKDPVIARGIADAFRDADLAASAVVDGWHGDLEAAPAELHRTAVRGRAMRRVQPHQSGRAGGRRGRR